jgi:hypothetical protein
MKVGLEAKAFFVVEDTLVECCYVFVSPKILCKFSHSVAKLEESDYHLLVTSICQ